MSDMSCDSEDKAFLLLMTVIQLGKAGQPYKKELDELKIAIKSAPQCQELLKSVVRGYSK